MDHTAKLGFLERNFINLKLLNNYLEDLNWEELSKNKFLPIEFIEQHLNKFDPIGLALNPVLTREFIYKHLGKLELRLLGANPNLDMEFIKQHFDEFDKCTISKNPNLSLEFIRENLDKLEWDYLSLNPVLTQEFIEEHAHNINWYNLALAANENIDQNFIIKHFNKFNGNTILGMKFLDLAFIERYNVLLFGIFSKCFLSINPYLDLEIVKLYFKKEKFSTADLAKNPVLNGPFIDKHISEIGRHRYAISQNPNLSLSYILKKKPIYSHRIVCNKFTRQKYLEDKIFIMSQLKIDF